MTVLATSAGRREFLIVGAQTKDDETQILFEVVEYKVEAVEKFSIGNLQIKESKTMQLKRQVTKLLASMVLATHCITIM